MAKAKIGAIVLYCGHKATFIADIFEVGNVNVVRANGSIDKILNWNSEDMATHHLRDYPTAGFWRKDLGVIVVPKNQVIEL